MFSSIVLLLGTALRFYRLDFQSLWNDEGNSVRLAERSLRLIIEGAGGDIHPPGYYLLLSFWRDLIGQSEFAMRSLSAFASILLIAVVIKIGNRRIGLLAGLFVAVNPLLIYYAQETRMYALEALWAGLLLWTTLRFWQTKRTNWLIATTLFTLAGLYTHYSFPFVIAAINSVALLSWLTAERQLLQLIRWVAGQALALLGFLPWLPIAWRQITTWPSSGEQAAFGSALQGTMRWLVSGDYFYGHLFWIAMALVPLILSLLTVRKSWAYWVAFGVPCGLMLGLGLFQPLFAKFLVVAVPSLALAQASGVERTRVGLRDNSKLTVVAGLVMTLGTVPTALNNLYTDASSFRDDYRAMAAVISSNPDTNPAIILNAPNQWEVFTYYYPDGANVYPIAKQRPVDFDAEFNNLETIVAEHSTIYGLIWGETAADPERRLENWLNQATFKVSDQWFGNVRLVQYLTADASELLQTHGTVPEADFTSQLSLLRAAIASEQYQPGDTIPIVMEWVARPDIALRLKLFIHVYTDPNAPPQAQLDTEPLGGLRPTDTWQPDETLVDQYAIQLPTDIPPGTYQIAVGWYNSTDGQRLATSIGDRVVLKTVEVTP